MTDKCIEPFAAVEVFCDGFTGFRLRNGVMSCYGYRLQEIDGEDEPSKIVVIRLVFPKDSVPQAIMEAQAALNPISAIVASVGKLLKAH